jgi:hypothetical protein
VKVVSAGGEPVQGATVTFAVTAGAAVADSVAATTGADGQAQTRVTLGSSSGNVTISATVSGTQLVATFVATAGATSTSTACASSTAQTPALGAVLPGVNGTGICLGGASGAEYALVVFNSNTDSSAIQPLSISARGATAITTASVTPSLNTTAAFDLYTEPSNAQSNLDARLRDAARRELTPLISAARARMRQSAAYATIPANPAIGTTYTLNTNSTPGQACTPSKNRTARVAAVSNTAIIVADTDNPTGGFTDAEYMSFATMFDTLIHPLDIAQFGAPSDIDKNGKIVIFFTKEVNALTPKTGSDGTVGGFFFERDLFPTTGNAQFQGCAGSNFAEMFYMLVPDPTGVFSVSHSKQEVLEITPGTIAHEYQHLINAGRRMYVNDADDFEDTWLNEGLSHIAEELLYYKVSGNSPRQNIGFTQLVSSQAAASAFNNYQGDNNARYEQFLAKPNRTSVYGGEDSLETRGAAWSLLRYLADHRGTGDGDVWMQLANSRLRGHINVARVFGANYMTQIRDWATSVYADDVPGVTDARFLQPSWNMRSIFPNLCGNASCSVRLNRFPITVVPLSDASPANISVQAGGAAYLRFAVPANGQASIDWTAGGLPVSGLIQFTVVRTK